MPKKRAPGTIDRRGDTFRVRLMVHGVRHSFTVETADRRVAEDFAWRKMAELRQAPASTLRLPRMSELFRRFEVVRFPELAKGAAAAYRDSLKPLRLYFCEALADPPVAEVRKADVVEFLAWRRRHRMGGGAAVSNRTLQKDRAVLHRVFQFAQDLEWREANPVALVASPRVERREPVLLTVAEYGRLLAACGDDDRLRLYLLVLGETGLRCKSEALWLRWEDVELEAGVLTVRSGREGHRTKSGKSRRVPMSPRLVEAMRAHFARYRLAMYFGQRSPWVFHHECNRRNAIAGDRLARVDHSVAAVAKWARLPAGWHQHDLRHRRATTWIAEGRPLPAVQKAMGHSTIKVTEQYVHLVDEHIELLRPSSARGRATSG